MVLHFMCLLHLISDIRTAAHCAHEIENKTASVIMPLYISSAAIFEMLYRVLFSHFKKNITELEKLQKSKANLCSIGARSL